MKCFARVTAVLLLCSGLGPTGAGAGAADVPFTIDEDGPAQGVQPLALRELWRVGGENESVMFGRIAGVKMHPDGTFYILDNQLCQVVVLSAAGEHVRSISREGDGPGELRQPVGLALLADDILGVAMGFPGKLVRVFGRRWEGRKRTPAEKDRVSPLIDPGRPETTDWTIEDHERGHVLPRGWRPDGGDAGDR